MSTVHDDRHPVQHEFDELFADADAWVYSQLGSAPAVPTAPVVDGLLTAHAPGETPVAIATQLRDFAAWFKSQGNDSAAFVAELLDEAASDADRLQCLSAVQLRMAKKWEEDETLSEAKLAGWHEGYDQSFNTFRYRKPTMLTNHDYQD